MAEQSQNPGAVTNSFTKGMVKDINETFVGEGLWTHARNLVNNSHDGNTGIVGNEPANLHCVTLPYTLIGAIHLTDDQWAIFTTDDVNSEIGVFDESQCTYTKKVNDSCLGFKRTNLITGVSRRRYDCALPVYWADGLNPDRFMDIENPPFKYTEKVVNGCIIKTYTDELDCEKIRLAALLDQPCLTLSKGKGAGTLANGTYQVCIAYTVNQVKITDYIGLSNPQSLFSHDNVNSSLQVTISKIDQDFDEFELVVISNINAQAVAKRLGFYSTSQGIIYIDSISPELVSIPLNQLPLRSEAIEKSDAIYSLNGYMLRVGSYSKFQFNYQKQANNITSKWVAVEYPAEYYVKGGNKVGYLRDEQYAFFIRWIYNTGERSASFHIPGRPATAADTVNVVGGDAFETINGISRQLWQVQNTATVESLATYYLEDGGKVVASGKMGYWESTETYPADRPDIWDNLCGKPIRHHKFPDVTVDPLLNHFNTAGQTIVVLGVQFDNITVPLDIDGKPIASITGYEILRGSREGNKSIVAKGMFNNLREYDIPGNTTTKGLYQNYPYNDLSADTLLTSDYNIIKKGTFNQNLSSPLTAYKKDMFSFHSPDTTFTKPFLSFTEVKVYEELTGNAVGSFVHPYKHPKFKVLTNFASQLSSIIGTITAIGNFLSTIAQDSNLTLQGTDELPYTKKLTLTKVPNFPIGVSALGSGATIPNPVIVGYNTAIGVYNGAVALAMSFIEAEAVGEQLFNIIRGLVPRRQYAVQYNSHGFYNTFKVNPSGNRRKEIENATYVSSGLQSFDTTYSINNLYRSNFVAVKIKTPLTNPTTVDNSRFRIGKAGGEVNNPVTSTISGYYGAMKVTVPSQYGQLESIKQMLIGGCVHPIVSTTSKYSTTVLFGGDTYIGRFTEKNTFFFYNAWLMGEPDETDYNYRDYINVAYPRFWIDSNKVNFDLFKNASINRHLDERESSTFFVKKGFFYLFHSGVRDFFVESEINLAHRDWEDEISKRHYDPYGYQNIEFMLRSDIIKSGNYYKYDYSLSVSKLITNFASWGNIYPRDYDPKIADSCYVYRPKRVLYSLPQDQELKKDNWRLFLTNNYKDFNGQITVVKPVNKTGALFMINNQSPVQFTGVDQLQTDIGTKITIGDGGLFQQPLQNLANSDESYEYGSCQNKFAVAGTTHGVFWVSQNQGKVFQYAGQLNEISRNGMKWWFAKYLPSELLKTYPTYPLYDNPVIGIGVQMIYDNTHEILYITKKDYKPKRSDLLYDANGFYQITGYSTVVNPPTTKYECPSGYTLINNQCVRVSTTSPIESGTVVNLTRTPYEVYGTLGTKVYDTASTSGTFTLLSTSNLFWIRTASPGNWSSLTAEEKQAYDLNNGPVNRLAVWGDNDGANLNNYNHGGANLNPVNTWIGFDVCINIQATKTYYVAIAGDNQYRFSLDGTVILSETSSNTANFNYLHIYPVTITAGSHILRVEGLNTGAKAGFGCEVFDLSDLPGGQSVTDFLNAQTNYDNLESRVIFTTRTATQFSSNLYSCPAGYGLSNPSCNQPICQLTETTSPTVVTIPGSTIRVPIKQYSPFSDKNVWEDASWTVSYDPKTQMWLSFHDWKPTFLLPSKTHFMSVDSDSIWKHNQRCDLFCNFYGVDYPFEVEFVSSTGQMVNSVRNIEYVMEAYRFYNYCADKFHILDQNFDQAMVYNSEQVSGLLELVIKDKSNPLNLLTYPQVGPQSIKINFSKEEQKYRFNQFWDITKDRGEFTAASGPMFITSPNGYEFQINPGYVNYQKPVLERKKFRHNVNRVWLRKFKSADVKLLLKLSNQKLLQSPR